MPFLSYKRSFCQDRLGTNIGKRLKTMAAFSYTCRRAPWCGSTGSTISSTASGPAGTTTSLKRLRYVHIYMYSLYNICTYHHYTSQIYEVYILCTINDIVNIRIIFPRTQPPSSKIGRGWDRSKGASFEFAKTGWEKKCILSVFPMLVPSLSW